MSRYPKQGCVCDERRVSNRERKMTRLSEVPTESRRIEFLLRRDGYEATRKWVERTAGLYRAALGQRHHYAATHHFRPLFESAVREFESWLAAVRI